MLYNSVKLSGNSTVFRFHCIVLKCQSSAVYFCQLIHLYRVRHPMQTRRLKTMKWKFENKRIAYNVSVQLVIMISVSYLWSRDEKFYCLVFGNQYFHFPNKTTTKKRFTASTVTFKSNSILQSWVWTPPYQILLLALKFSWAFSFFNLFFLWTT